jgi:diacylglycerol kinase (ATP)
MTSRPRFSFAARVRSFQHAFRGLFWLVTGEHNAWIHAVTTLLVILSGTILDISLTEWALLALAIAAVWTAEALNAAIERLGDAISEAPHPLVGAAKDLGAAGVLASAAGAATVGLVVLGPRILTALGLS